MIRSLLDILTEESLYETAPKDSRLTLCWLRRKEETRAEEGSVWREAELTVIEGGGPLSLVKMEPVEAGELRPSGSLRPVQTPQISVEEALRLVRELAVKLLVPQTAVATAQTFLHRVKPYAVLLAKVPERANCRSCAIFGLQAG